MDIFMIKKNSMAIPAFGSDHEKFKKIHEGEMVKFVLLRPRNIGLHRKYFALIGCLHHALNENQMKMWPQPDNLRDALLVAIGHCETTYLHDGTPQQKAKSISFASTDNIEFEKIYSDTLDAGLKHFLKDITPEQFEAELINFM